MLSADIEIPGLVDVRAVHSAPCMVLWTVDPLGEHTVTVTHLGDAVAEIHCRDGAEARSAFDHPFARPEVPNVFAVAAVD